MNIIQTSKVSLPVASLGKQHLVCQTLSESFLQAFIEVLDGHIERRGALVQYTSSTVRHFRVHFRS